MPSVYVNVNGAAPVNATSNLAVPPLQIDLSPKIEAVALVTETTAAPIIFAPVPLQPEADKEVTE